MEYVVVDTSPPWQPAWIDVNRNHVWRSYGAWDGYLEIRDQRLVCRVSNSARRFVSFFGPFFTIALFVVVWVLPIDLQHRAAIGLIVLVGGATTFGFTYWLFRRHEESGEYIRIDKERGDLGLPRHNVRWPLQDVVGFQWAVGPERAWNTTVNGVDLNVLIKADDQLRRYLVATSPNWDDAIQIATFAEKPLWVLECGFHGVFRDSARATG